jgi:hypothetical protein
MLCMAANRSAMATTCLLKCPSELRIAFRLPCYVSIWFSCTLPIWFCPVIAFCNCMSREMLSHCSIAW